MFEAWGRFVFRWRWATLAVSTLFLAISVVVVTQGGTLGSGNSVDSTIEAAQAAKLIKEETQGGAQAQSGATFLLILSSRALPVTDPAFRAALEAAITPLRSSSHVRSIDTPYSVPAPAAAALTSRNGREALVVVHLRDGSVKAQKYYQSLRDGVNSSSLQVMGTGKVAINRAFGTTLESDLGRAEVVSIPVSLILLLIVFGTVVAALLPIGVGVLAVVAGVAGTLLLSRFTDVSQYALNIVSLIGLGVAIDYSLFIVSRFREELLLNSDREVALARTMATAGRAISFSGVTVAIGLSAMLFYRGTFLASMGAAGGIVVALAVFYALTFLPALLAVLGSRVDRLGLPWVRPGGGGGFWRGLAGWVMDHPALVLIPSLAALILMAAPFTHIRLANGDVDMLPTRLEARQGYDRLLSDFPGHDQNTFGVVLDYAEGSPLTPARIATAYRLSRRLARLPGVLRVTGPLDLDPSLGLADYQRLYALPPEQRPGNVQQALAAGAGSHILAMQAVSSRKPSSDAARVILREIRAQRPPGAQLLVTGDTAFDVDVIEYIVDHTPLAVGFVLIVTYVILFLLTGSVVLPLKAVLTNLLSVAASLGALVWIFQDGHLSSVLGFSPQSLDPTIPVILFSIVFGLSMDYEVLLVARIHEEYRRTGDNRVAVAEGLEKSGRLITGAAAIMVAVFMAFGLAEVVLIKSIGIGLAIAIALDATIVRALLVPAVMRLLGDHNWWAPRPLAGVADRLKLRNVHGVTLEAGRSAPQTRAPPSPSPSRSRPPPLARTRTRPPASSSPGRSGAPTAPTRPAGLAAAGAPADPSR